MTMLHNSSIRRQVPWTSKKGFALILVFSLASIVLLLALSLVSLTQVETASSRYEQSMRVARANARLGLEMAIGDLQRLAGPDQRITATADGRRADEFENFNSPSDPIASQVYQPFWTGVWDNNNAADSPQWLVTRPIDGSLVTVDPYVDGLGTNKELVKLVGENSAKPASSTNQSRHDVLVPKEVVVSDGLVGFDGAETAAVGHYAYWVGDNGVKASYLLQDLVPEVLHEPYATAPLEQRRLRQMMSHRNRLAVVEVKDLNDPDDAGRPVDATNAWMESIASPLALREEVHDPKDKSALGSFTQNDVRRRFHDFAALSKGLLANTVNGGLREDLSVIHEVNTDDDPTVQSAEEDLINNYLMPYLNMGRAVASASTGLLRSYMITPVNTALGLGQPAPVVSPVVVGFKFDIRVSVDLDRLESPPYRSDVYGQFRISVKLWNPYTSRIQADKLMLSVDRISSPFPAVEVTYHDSNGPQLNADTIGLLDLCYGWSDFEIIPKVSLPVPTEDWWEPGEIRVFSGTYDPDFGTSRLEPGALPRKDFEFPIPGLRFTSDDLSQGLNKISISGAAWNPELVLRLGTGEELYRFSFKDISFNDIESIPVIANSIAQPILSFTWELRDPDLGWTNFDPRSGKISNDEITEAFDDPNITPPEYNPADMKYLEYPGSLRALSYVMSNTTMGVMGYNSSGNVTHNIPVFELPRQEFVSLASLQMAAFPSGLRGHLGMPLAASAPQASINGIFDRYFLSTVPHGSASWIPRMPLPNTRMEPLEGSVAGDFIDENTAADLFFNGAFNLNSTSIEAWEAVLKGIRLGTWQYYDPETSNVGEWSWPLENQFFRFSQSAEETWGGAYTTDDLGKARQFFRRGIRSLTNAQVEELARQIVYGIRTRRQRASTPMGPFRSLQDFIDAGVIAQAIVAAKINDDIRIDIDDPLTEVSASSSYLTQQDVLTAIAPFLSARSDTFVVRAYGDAVNPQKDSEILARAYCEAIVQRVHEKHPTDPASGDVMAATGELAGEFGRKFKVIAFRWKTGDEI